MNHWTDGEPTKTEESEADKFIRRKYRVVGPNIIPGKEFIVLAMPKPSRSVPAEYVEADFLRAARIRMRGVGYSDDAQIELVELV